MDGLHWADYLIFSAFLLASLFIGLYHAFSGNRQRTTQEFIMADRNLKVVPTMLSLMVSYQSALMILGFTAEMYSYGTPQWFGSFMGYPLAILLAERLFVPWIFPLKLTSVYEVSVVSFIFVYQFIDREGK
jgi:Na+/proline symporter